MPPEAPTPHPWVWAVLYFPLGLAIGFPSVALGYFGSRAGLELSAVAAIVGMTFLGSGWKFLSGGIGPEFRASADVVSVVLGLGGGLAIVAGCMAGGWLIAYPSRRRMRWRVDSAWSHAS